MDVSGSDSTHPAPSTIYDTAIIGGGPAGLTAAIYLGRALRSTIVIDTEAPGRSNWLQMNHNYLGFPDGIPVRELADRGREQARKYGATFVDARATKIRQESPTLFMIWAEEQWYRARTVILATGVTDRWVEFPGSADKIGRSMHWCVVCDGFEMQGQRVLIVGNTAEVVEEARQLQRFTSSVELLLEPDEHEVTPAQIGQLEAAGIEIHYGRIAGAACEQTGMCKGIVTDQGDEIALDHIFSLLGATPNVHLAEQLDIELTEGGFIQVDTEARTSVPGVFAAGDVTNLFSQQVLSAAHEGATAAMAIASDLWSLEND
jgi:thioredoxin reductase (NADPH)